MRVLLTIDGQQADLPAQDLNLGLIYEISTQEGLTGNSGTRSEYSFTLPATKANNAIFGAYWQVDLVGQESKAKLLPCSIEVDGLPFFEGQAVLRSVDLKGAQHELVGASYKVALFGNNSSWALALKGRKLVEFCQDIPTHIYQLSSITTGVGNVHPTDSAGTPSGGSNTVADWGYCLIKWQDWALPNAVQWQEYTPHLFVKALLYKIFNGLGYSIQSDFLATDFFSRLRLPIPFPDRLGEDYGQDFLNYSGEAVNQLTPFSGPPIQNMPFPTNAQQPTNNPGIYNTTTGVYTPVVQGFYLFVVNISEIDVLTNPPTEISIGITGGGTAGYTGIRIKVADLPAQNVRFERVLQLSAGQIAYISCTGYDSSGLLTGFGDTQYSGTLEILGEAEILAGLELNFKYLINKSWGALEFIQGLAHAFNLRFETDTVRRQITIEPADGYLYAQQVGEYSQVNDGFYTGQTDLTQQLDLLPGGQLDNSQGLPAKYRLAWKADSGDSTAEALANDQEQPLLAAEYVFQDSQKTDTEEIQNPFFAPTLCIFDNAILAEDTELVPQLPIIWPSNYLEDPTADEHKDKTKYLPRLLYGEPYGTGPRNGRLNFIGAPDGIADAPLNYMVNYNNLDGLFISLSFGSSQINGNTVQGLMARFYLSQLRRLEAGKLLTCTMIWKRQQLANLSFRTKVLLAGSVYLLQSVGRFNILGAGPTKTNLIYDTQPEAADLDKIAAGPSNKLVE